MKEITPESLEAFFRPPTQGKIEQEAGLYAGRLSKLIKKKRKLTRDDIEKLRPVLERYGF